MVLFMHITLLECFIELTYAYNTCKMYLGPHLGHYLRIYYIYNKFEALIMHISLLLHS